MARTYDEESTSLPPLTRAIVDTYGRRTPGSNWGAPLDPVFTVEAFSAMLDAVRALEDRVIALEAP